MSHSFTAALPLPPPPSQLEWALLPADDGAAAPAARYAIQRWPQADMPAPGQPYYQTSLLSLRQEYDAAQGTWSATDGGAPRSHFYRVLALAADGGLLGATRPSQPSIIQGEIFWVWVCACGATSGLPCCSAASSSAAAMRRRRRRQVS